MRRQALVVGGHHVLEVPVTEPEPMEEEPGVPPAPPTIDPPAPPPAPPVVFQPPTPPLGDEEDPADL